MLNRIREKHSKKILWVLSIIIIISFTLWGSASFFQRKNEQVMGEISGKKITLSDFGYYYKLAQLRFHLMPGNDTKKQITSEEISGQAWQYVLLLWKVKEEKIKVDDQEVIATVKNIFFPKEDFNREIYLQFLKRTLQMNPRGFEECVRNFISIDKLFAKYIKVDVIDEEIKQLYKREQQKVKITYLFIPYKNFITETAVEPQEIETFYAANKETFWKEPNLDKDKPSITPPLEEVKPEIEKQLLAKKTKEKAKLLSDEIVKKIKDENIKDLSTFAEKNRAEFKQTDFFKYADSVEITGLEKFIHEAAFSLEKGDVYLTPLLLSEGAYIVQLMDISAVDEKDFQEKKDKYSAAIYQQKSFFETYKFISSLEKEANLKIQSLAPTQ